MGGRGVVNHFGLEGEVDIEIGSLSKAFSVMGGFIAAKQPLIDHYMMNARQRLMSIALTIPDTAALLEAVAMLSEDTRLVDKLWANVHYLNKGFMDMGFDIGTVTGTLTPTLTLTLTLTVTLTLTRQLGDADHPGDDRRRGEGQEVQTLTLT